MKEREPLCSKWQKLAITFAGYRSNGGHSTAASSAVFAPSLCPAAPLAVFAESLCSAAPFALAC